jgi:hypothetical protein
MDLPEWKQKCELESPFWLEHCSDKEYALEEALNASLIRAAHRFPEHMVRREMNRVGFASNNLSLGQLMHQFWLEPHLAEKHWAILPKKFESSTPESRKKRGAFESEHKAQGREVLPESLWESVQRGLEALQRNEEATSLLSQAKKEVSVYWKDAELGVYAKARFDLLGEDHFWDLKCHHGSMQREKFQKNLAQMGFYIQIWWYRRALRLSNLPINRCGHIALDTDIWEVQVREMSPQDLVQGRDQGMQAWWRLKKMLAGRFAIMC